MERYNPAQSRSPWGLLRFSECLICVCMRALLLTCGVRLNGVSEPWRESLWRERSGGRIGGRREVGGRTDGWAGRWADGLTDGRTGRRESKTRKTCKTRWLDRTFYALHTVYRGFCSQEVRRACAKEKESGQKRAWWSSRVTEGSLMETW